MLDNSDFATLRNRFRRDAELLLQGSTLDENEEKGKASFISVSCNFCVGDQVVNICIILYLRFNTNTQQIPHI